METRLAKWWVGQDSARLLRRGYERRAQDLADEIRSRWLAAAGPTGSQVDPTRLARRAGWRLIRANLRATSRGLQAALVPSGIGFAIVVDPRPVPGRETGADGKAVLWARVGHELGHAFFYEPGRPPRRVAPPSQREEQFCDIFAAALLRGPQVSAREVRKVLTGGRAVLSPS